MSNNTEPMVHKPDLNAIPNKPALVTSKDQKKKEVSLTWDEHAIEEHDQLRGTRMKIDEPDTPFAYEHHSDSEASVGSHHSKDAKGKHLNWSHLENKLGAVAAVRATLPPSPSMSSQGGNSSGPDSDFELDGKRKKTKAKEFEMHRKAHYNEMEAVRNWRAEHTNDDDDDDE
eukprot:scaffold4124_cov267-Chaetoceros_neogracile.AAC.42